MILDVLAAVATFACVVTFAYLARTERALPFYWANCVGGIILGYYNFLLQAYASLALNVAFGGFALQGLIRAWRATRRPEPPVGLVNEADPAAA